MKNKKYIVQICLSILITLSVVSPSYAVQDIAVLNYLNNLRTTDSALPNVPNQKGSFGYVLSQIFGTGSKDGKIKQDYLDLPSGLVVNDASTTTTGIVLLENSTGSTSVTKAPTSGIIKSMWDSLMVMMGQKLDNSTTASIATCTGTTQKILWDSVNNRFTCGTDTDAWSTSSGSYYTKTNLQTNGQAQVDFHNITNVPNAGTGTNGIVMLENSTGSVSQYTAPTSNIIKQMWDSLLAMINTKIGGTGTDSYLAKFSGTGNVTVSQVYDNGTNVGIGNNSPGEKLEVTWNLKLWWSTPTYRIKNLAEPVENNDAANKIYVDSTVSAGTATVGASKYLENGSYYSEWGDPYFCRLNTLEGTTQRIVSVNQNKLCNTASNLYCNAGACTADSSILNTIKQTHQLISARDHQSCSINDGQVHCWGYSGNGQKYLDMSMSSGNNSYNWHACTVLADGRVSCWGSNDYGQLGVWNTTTYYEPVIVSGISNAVKVYTVSSGYSTDNGRSCALLSDGTVKCWGYLPSYGQTSTPVAITGLSGVVDFSMSQENSAAEWHWCAVLNTGVVKCAGTGNYGQLWDGTVASRNWITTPITVSGISNAKKVYTVSSGYSTNYGYSCALLSDGWLKCWGYFRSGAGQSLVPISIFGSPQIQVQSASLSSGNGSAQWHSCYVGSGSTAWHVYCMGSGDYGQLGNGTNVNSIYPVEVSGITNAITVYTTSAGYSTPYGRSCALLSDTTVKCWGYLPSYGSTNTPIAIAGLTGVTDFSMSQDNGGTLGHWCAVLSTGVVKCAGTGDYGQLGNGGTSNADWINWPVTVSNISNATKIYTASSGYSTDYGYSCALLSDGWLKCWGYLRIGWQSNTPVSMFGGPQISSASLSSGNNSGEWHSCYVGSGSTAGRVYCMGTGNYGQLGNGGTTNVNTYPAEVIGITNAVKVYTASSGYTTNYGRSCALLSDTTVKCWGYLPSYGQTNVPVAITGLTGVTDFSMSQDNGGSLGHWCAILSDGTGRCAGTNTYGQLGNNTTTASSWLTPVTVTGLTGASKIYVSQSGYSTDHGMSCALLSSGGMKCWGDNTFGQLWDGTTTQRSIPTSLAGMGTASGMSLAGAGGSAYNHACEVETDGTVKCWGDNSYGQIGDGTTTVRYNPTTVIGISNAVKVYTAISSYSTPYGRSCALLSDTTVKCWG